MDFCCATPCQNETLRTLEKMLKNSTADDKCLLLAYGYFGYLEEVRDAVSAWFQAQENRQIFIIVGWIEQRARSEYLSYKNDEYTPVPYEFCPGKFKSDILPYITRLLEPIAADLRLDDNFAVIGVAGYHGKAAVLLDDIDCDLNSEELGSHWSPNELLLGSSNLTANALLQQFELDVYLQRTDQNALVSFTQSSRAYFAELVKRTEGSVCKASKDFTAILRNDIFEFCLAEQQKKVRAEKNAAEAERKALDAEMQ